MGNAGGVTAYEKFLDKGYEGAPHDGTAADGKETWTAPQTLSFATEDGFSSVTISGTELTAPGTYAITGNYGTLHVTLNLATDGKSGTVVYQYLLTEAVQHADGKGANTDLATGVAPENFSVVVKDIDGDTSTSTISVTIVDDVPLAFTPDSATISDVAGSHFEGNVGANWGADGQHGSQALIFTPNPADKLTVGGETVYKTKYASEDGEPIYFRVSDNGATLEGATYNAANNTWTTVLEAKLDANGNSYSLDLHAPIAYKSEVHLVDMSKTESGNKSAGYLVADEPYGFMFNAPSNPGHILAHVTTSATVNTSTNGIGIQNQFCTPGDWMRLDFAQPQSVVTVTEAKGGPLVGNWTAYGADGTTVVATGTFSVPANGTIVIEPGVTFQDVRLDFTGNSKGTIASIGCNASIVDEYPTLDLPVQVMDADGDAVASNIHITLTGDQDPTNVTLPALAGATFSMTGALLQAGLGGNAAYLMMETGNDTLVSGERLNFDLHLRTAQGGDLAAQAAIMAVFKVANDAGDFSVPEDMLGKVQTDAHGNTLTWTQDAHGEYILTAVMAPGQSVLHVAFDAFHTQDTPGFVDPGQTLHLTLQSMTDMDGMPLPGLDAAIHTEDGPSFYPGDHVEFTVVCEDYGYINALHGITHEEAVGKEIVHVASTEMGGLYDGNEAGHENGLIIIGTEGHDIIYASQGNDIMIGGSGNDTYVWNNNNIGQDANAVDVIKDFTLGDTLRFDDLFAEHGSTAESALVNLLQSGTITDGNFHATDGNTTIGLSVDDSLVTLSVSYGEYMQSVQLENFSMEDYTDTHGNLDQQAVVDMLSEIIKVGGNV
jgi:hypothetical protein